MNKDSNSESDENNKQQKDDANRECESRGEQLAPMMRECEFCGKKFNSGKALGGHKRFHIQAQKKERELANKLANTDGNNNNKNIIKFNEKLTCYLCYKDFASEKSLFGHMRSHPDRDWRGVQPPNTLIHSSSSHHDDDSMERNYEEDATTKTRPFIDVSKSLPLASWGKTDTRGRESVLTTAIRVLASLIDELHNNDNVLSDKWTMDDETSKKRKRFDTHHHCSEGVINNEENLETKDDGYKCNICNRSFPTFQELRRHRSSHNKDQNKSSMNNDEQRRSLINVKKESDEANNSKDRPRFDLNELPNNDKDEKN